ncbi:hypothetical protein [Reyranella sp.]|uniref:hypothetical protein n=1 Tax=Reyranella sp. TaxID=1929291 RepID=UPI003D135FD8
MRSIVAVVVLFALPAGGCTWRPVYENPPLQGKIERLWRERDDCLLANAPQVDDRSSDPRKVARVVAQACVTQTVRLMDMTIPEPDQKARDAFQAEAERRAADIVVTFRRVDAAAAQRSQQRVNDGAPAPLH